MLNVARKAFQSFYVQWAISYLALRILGFKVFYSFDSFHYMHLSLHPVWGESHPLGFGFLIRAWTEVLKWIGLGSLAADLFFAVQWGIGLWFLKAARPARGVLLGVFWCLLVPSVVFLCMAVWTEVLSLGIFLVLASGLQKKIPSIWTSCALGLAYHLRFQWVGLLVVWGGLAWRKSMTALMGGLLLFAASVVAGSSHFPRSPVASRHTLGQWMVSVQCQVGCAVPLFKNVCGSHDVASLLDRQQCSDLLLNHIPLGEPVAHSFAEVIEKIGIWNFIRWGFEAPLRFLMDQHRCWGLEVETFDFRRASGAEAYPEVVAHYGTGWTHRDPRPSLAIRGLLKWLEILHFKLLLFNIANAVMLVAGAWAWFKSRSSVVGFWWGTAVLSWLVFAYFNPHVPFRFLLQILLPAWMAWVTAQHQRADAQGKP